MQRWLWIGLTLLLVIFLFLSKAILLPFVAGLAVAYFLDPAADKFEEWKLPRSAAAATVLGLFFLIITVIIISLWPVLQIQIAAVAKSLPQTIAGLRPWINEQLSALDALFGTGVIGDVDSLFAQISTKAFTQLQAALSGLLKSGIALFNVISLLLITPVVAFYLLRDWDHLVEKVDSWLPTVGAGTIRIQMVKLDTVLAGFVRGQILVCTVMAILYSIGWSVVGLKYGLVLGLLAGVLGFIPFIGTLFAAIIAVVMAFSQWGFEPVNIGLVLGVYFIVQILEGAVLTPRFIGERVGLHPVWVLFAVFAGGEIMGFVGVLIAVPVAAALAVFVRFAIDRYLEHYTDQPEQKNQTDQTSEQPSGTQT